MYSNAKLNEIRNPILRPNMENSVQYCQLLKSQKVLHNLKYNIIKATGSSESSIKLE